MTLADGTITYTPDAGFAGPATFTYTVCDDGTTNAAPDPLCDTAERSPSRWSAPTSRPSPTARTSPSPRTTRSPIVLTGSDPDGDPITFAIATPPAHGTLSGTAPNVTYTPAADYFGPDSFTFTTNDGATASVPATVSITVTEVNDPPVVGTDAVHARWRRARCRRRLRHPTAATRAA